MVKRILVGLDGSPYSSVAIQYATELALNHAAQLTGVTVVDEKHLCNIGPVPMGAAAAAEELREHRLQVGKEHLDQAVATFEQACREKGLSHEVDREEGNQFDLITSLARYYDLTVFGLRSIFECGVIGEAQYDPGEALIKLVSSGVRPIIAVGPEYRPIRRAMIAYSGSMESAKTMRRFIQLRLWPDVQVQIAVFGKTPPDRKRFIEDAAVYCQAHHIHAELANVDASPKEALLPHAQEWGADLIVIGNSAKRLFLRKIFGEVALKVIRESDRTLFLSQ